MKIKTKKFTGLFTLICTVLICASNTYGFSLKHELNKAEHTAKKAESSVKKVVSKVKDAITTTVTVKNNTPKNINYYIKLYYSEMIIGEGLTNKKYNKDGYVPSEYKNMKIGPNESQSYNIKDTNNLTDIAVILKDSKKGKIRVHNLNGEDFYVGNNPNIPGIKISIAYGSSRLTPHHDVKVEFTQK